MDAERFQIVCGAHLSNLSAQHLESYQEFVRLCHGVASWGPESQDTCGQHSTPNSGLKLLPMWAVRICGWYFF